MITRLESKNLNYLPPDRDCFSLYASFYRNTISMGRHGFLHSLEDAWLALCSDAGAWYVRGIGIWIVQCKSTHQLIGTAGFWQSKSKARVFELDLLPYMVDYTTRQEIVQTLINYHNDKFCRSKFCVQNVVEYL